MILSADEILRGFDHLPTVEQRKVAAETLRRYQSGAGSSLTDDELVACAEDLFLALDLEEAARGGSAPSR